MISRETGGYRGGVPPACCYILERVCVLSSDTGLVLVFTNRSKGRESGDLGAGAEGVLLMEAEGPPNLWDFWFKSCQLLFCNRAILTENFWAVSSCLTLNFAVKGTTIVLGSCIISLPLVISTPSQFIVRESKSELRTNPS